MSSFKNLNSYLALRYFISCWLRSNVYHIAKGISSIICVWGPTSLKSPSTKVLYCKETSFLTEMFPLKLLISVALHVFCLWDGQGTATNCEARSVVARPMASNAKDWKLQELWPHLYVFCMDLQMFLFAFFCFKTVTFAKINYVLYFLLRRLFVACSKI